MANVPLEELQQYIFGILVEFDRICRKHNIKYSLEGGTLLGAIKYKGFVPWDDDIDVVMTRIEYDKFMKIAPSELASEYTLQNYDSAEEFPLNYAKLCYNKSTIYDYDYSHLTKMNHGIFMDIFPIDHVIPKKLRFHCSCVGVLTGARKTKLKIPLKGNRLKRFVYKLLSVLPMKSLNRLLTRTCTKYNKNNTGYSYEICNSNRKFPPILSSFYDDLIEVEFNGKLFYAFREYDDFLKTRFGNNYMNELPDEKLRKPSHNQNILILK